LSDQSLYDRLRARLFDRARMHFHKGPECANPRLACQARCYRDATIRTLRRNSD
jgi:hypothetical protein